MPTETEIRKIKRLIVIIWCLMISAVASGPFIGAPSLLITFLGFLVTIYLIYYMIKIEKRWDKDKDI